MGSQVATSRYSIYRGSMGYQGWDYPNPADNGVLADIVYVMEGTSVRGYMPGLFAPANAVGSSFLTGDLSMKNPNQMPNSEFVYIRLGAGNGGYIGGCFFDITGPWD